LGALLRSVCTAAVRFFSLVLFAWHFFLRVSSVMHMNVVLFVAARSFIMLSRSLLTQHISYVEGMQPHHLVVVRLLFGTVGPQLSEDARAEVVRVVGSLTDAAAHADSKDAKATVSLLQVSCAVGALALFAAPDRAIFSVKNHLQQCPEFGFRNWFSFGVEKDLLACRHDPNGRFPIARK
jgi:hypothetical protein